MTNTASSLSNICLGMLFLLLIYTIWQLRSRRLDARVTVQWILAESGAVVAILLWRWLPLFKITSTLGDRELLMVLTVIFFALIAFLMIDSLTRISTHTRQIKQLAQELALLRASTDVPDEEFPSLPVGPVPQEPPIAEDVRPKQSVLRRLLSGFLALWIIGVMVVMYAVTRPTAFDGAMASIGLSAKVGDVIRAQLTRKNLFQEAEK